MLNFYYSSKISFIFKFSCCFLMAFLNTVSLTGDNRVLLQYGKPYSLEKQFNTNSNNRNKNLNTTTFVLLCLTLSRKLKSQRQISNFLIFIVSLVEATLQNFRLLFLKETDLKSFLRYCDKLQ